MANASKDSNGVSTMIAALNTDGKTVVPIQINPANHKLAISDAVGGSDNGPTVALKDGNDVSSLVAVSNADGKTPVALYADSTGKLLVQSA